MQNIHCWSRFYRDFWVNVFLDCILGTLLSLSGNIPFQRYSCHRTPRPSMKFKVNELCFLSITVLARPYMFACLCTLYWNVFCCLLSSGWGGGKSGQNGINVQIFYFWVSCTVNFFILYFRICIILSFIVTILK